VAAALVGQAGRRAAARRLATLPSGWRNNTVDRQDVTFSLQDDDVTVAYRMGRRGDSVVEVAVGGRAIDASADDCTPDRVTLTVDGVTRRYTVQRVGAEAFVDGPDGSSRLVEHERLPMTTEQVVEGSALAPMPGSVVRVTVGVGDRVEAGQVLVVLEAMKMEHSVHAGASGTVVEVDVAEGDQVETGRILAIVEADGAADGAGEPAGT
jgi:propionyl-CoA carboxylase alpha chain